MAVSSMVCHSIILFLQFFLTIYGQRRQTIESVIVDKDCSIIVVEDSDWTPGGQ